MGKIKIDRKPELVNNEVIIKSNVLEHFELAEYEQLYTEKAKNTNALDFAIRNAKQRLEKLGESEKRAEDLKPDKKVLLEMSRLALELQELDTLKEKLKEMEIRYDRYKIELESLKPVYNKIKK